MRTVTRSEVETYLDRARNGDHRAASRLALGLLDDGVPVDRVIEDLLVAAQVETGQRWLRAEWSVADEHVVTTTTTAVTEAVAAVADQEGDRGQVTVVCAEGDWHSMPSRLCAEQLRARGWLVRFLGASTPADQVAEYLQRAEQDALIISCTLPLHFAGAARLADVAHQQGIPALIGGAAVAGAPLRAVALGADVAVNTVGEADRALEELGGVAIVHEPVALDEGAMLLDIDADEYAAAAMDRLAKAYPPMRDFTDRQLARTREDLAYIARFAAAALLVRDPMVCTSFASWQRALLLARNVADRAFDAGVEAISDEIESSHPDAAALLRASTTLVA